MMANLIAYTNAERTDLFGECQLGSLSYLFYPDYSPSGYWTQTIDETEYKIYCFGGSGSHTVDPDAPPATSLFSLAQAQTVDNTATIHVLYLSNNVQLRYEHYKLNGTTNRFTMLPPLAFLGGQWVEVRWNNMSYRESLDYVRADNAMEGVYFLQCLTPDFEWERPKPQPEVFIAAVKLIDTGTGSVGSFRYIRGWGLNLLEVQDSDRYRPTKTSVKGGGGSGVYPSTSAEQPNTAARNGWFTYASSNGYGICYYVVDSATLCNYLAFIYSHGLFVDHEIYREATVAAYKLPVTPSTGTSLNVIYVSNTTLTNGVSKADPISSRFVEGSTALIDISSYGYDTFADFSETDATLYLPFYGMVNIDINAIAHGRLQIKWLVDSYNGNICYWVYTQGMQDPKMILYGTYSGNCAVPIPVVGSGASGTMLGRVANIAGTLAVGATAGAAAGAMAAVNTIGNLTAKHIDRAGTMDTNSNTSCPYAITLQISARVMLTPDHYAETIGTPSAAPGNGDPGSVSAFSGFTIFRDFHADSISGATAREKEEIERLMRGGVFV